MVLIISSTVMFEPSMTRLMLTLAGVISFFCRCAHARSYDRFFRTPFRSR